MRGSTFLDTPAVWLNAEARALAAALALFAGILVFINSCGGGDLVFPGMVPTRQFTNTTGPTQTP